MTDYEQKYYDLLIEFKNIKKQKENLEQENYIYKSLLKNKPIKNIIATELVNYLKIGSDING